MHGAWHGGWCWERVADRLSRAGHSVQAPTLIGLGERASELDRSVGFERHVVDVLDALAAAESAPILVGHSYAALAVQAAAARAPERVRHAVYLEGWVGPDGSSLLSLAPDWFRDGIRHAAECEGDGWRIPPPAPIAVGVSDADDAAWLEARLTDHPLRTMTEPIRLEGAGGTPESATVADGGAIDMAALASALSVPVSKIAGGHDLMVTSPDALATALLEVA